MFLFIAVYLFAACLKLTQTAYSLVSTRYHSLLVILVIIANDNSSVLLDVGLLVVII